MLCLVSFSIQVLCTRADRWPTDWPIQINFLFLVYRLNVTSSMEWDGGLMSRKITRAPPNNFLMTMWWDYFPFPQSTGQRWSILIFTAVMDLDLENFDGEMFKPMSDVERCIRYTYVHTLYIIWEIVANGHPSCIYAYESMTDGYFDLILVGQNAKYPHVNANIWTIFGHTYVSHLRTEPTDSRHRWQSIEKSLQQKIGQYSNYSPFPSGQNVCHRFSVSK